MSRERIVIALIFLFFNCALSQNINQPINNDENNKVRPCDIFDTDCIRRYFANNSQCKIRYGTVPDPLLRPQSKAFLPRLNLTVDFVKVIYKGLNGRISEFFVNEETDRVVLAVEFRNLNTASNNTYFRFHRRGREPIVTKDYSYLNYKFLTVTIIIPQRKNLDLRKGEVFTFLNERVPDYSIGPNIFGTPDPTVQATAAQFTINQGINFIETQLTEGSFYITTFIQYTLCDFGLKLV